MRNILFERLASALLCCLLFHFNSVNAASPKFDTPPSGGGSGSIFENKAVGSTILTLQATDADGDSLTFSKVSQKPASPGFTINSNDELTVPSGLNFEETKLFTFKFRVSDGTNSVETTYTLTIKNVDDESPVFDKPSYSATIMESAKAGTSVVKVSATDVDSSAITYRIQGAQTIFKIDQSGYIVVADPSSMPTLKPTVTLNVQASDGKNQPAVVSVTITITDSPCSSAPCQNGGTCSVTGTTHKCTCLQGYIGDNCQSVDFCYNNPCKNNRTCHSGPVSYTCDCGLCFKDKNCTTAHNPCVHGVCKIEDNTCSCEKCYKGRLCDQDHNPCAHGRCSNNTCHCDLCYKGPQCEEAHNPCKHGTCQNDKCLCQKCYTGQLCNQDHNPCQHGTCSNNTCHCDFCYKGRNCEISHNPCVHGTCQDDKCSCQKCYKGKFCKQDHNPCQHGTCSENTCHCDFCYNGPNCETSHNPCVHGTCQDGKCSCQKCYKGRFCDQNHNPCVHGTCSNNACHCDFCYQGTQCENYHNPCKQGTCSNNTCHCDLCFKGTHCETYHNPCVHGTCTNNTCHCGFCYKGPHCENNHNPCEHGTCYNNTCHCELCYKGTQCEKSIPCKDDVGDETEIPWLPICIPIVIVVLGVVIRVWYLCACYPMNRVCICCDACKNSEEKEFCRCEDDDERGLKRSRGVVRSCIWLVCCIPCCSKKTGSKYKESDTVSLVEMEDKGLVSPEGTGPVEMEDKGLVSPEGTGTRTSCRWCQACARCNRKQKSPVEMEDKGRVSPEGTGPVEMEEKGLVSPEGTGPVEMEEKGLVSPEGTGPVEMEDKRLRRSWSCPDGRQRTCQSRRNWGSWPCVNVDEGLIRKMEHFLSRWKTKDSEGTGDPVHV